MPPPRLLAGLFQIVGFCGKKRLCGIEAQGVQFGVQQRSRSTARSRNTRRGGVRFSVYPHVSANSRKLGVFAYTSVDIQRKSAYEMYINVHKCLIKYGTLQ